MHMIWFCSQCCGKNWQAGQDVMRTTYLCFSLPIRRPKKQSRTSKYRRCSRWQIVSNCVFEVFRCKFPFLSSTTSTPNKWWSVVVLSSRNGGSRLVGWCFTNIEKIWQAGSLSCTCGNFLVGLVTVPIRKLEHQLRDRVPRETFRLIVAWVWLPDEDWWETMSRINEKTTFNGNQWVQVTAMLGIQKGVSGCNDNVAPPQLAGCSYNPMGCKIVSLNCICLGTRPLPCCPLHLSLARLRKVCLEANWYFVRVGFLFAHCHVVV